MEENIARIDEVDDIETVDEAEEVSENSSAGAFVAGIAGGILAYVVINGAKKLVAFAGTKWKARKHKKETADIIDAEVVEPNAKQADSSEETQNK